MRQNSENILNLINSGILSERNTFSTIVKEIQIRPEQFASLHDVNIQEFINQLNTSIELIKEACEENVMDDFSSQFRFNIYNTLSRIKEPAEKLFANKLNDQNAINNFIAQGNSLITQLHQVSLSLILNSIPELRKIQRRYKTALTRLESSERDLSKTNKILSSLKEKESNSIELHNSLIQTQNKVQQIFTSLNSEKEQINKEVKEIDDFFNNTFKPLLSQITNEESGFQAKINYSKSATEKLQTIANDVQQKHTLLEKAFSEFDDLHTKLNNLDSKLTGLYDKANDPNTGLEVKIAHVKELEESATLVVSALDELKESGRKNIEEIEKLKVKADSQFTQISEIHSNSETIGNDIKELYKISQKTLTGGIFDVTRKAFSNQRWIWLGVLVSAIIATSIVAYSTTAGYEKLDQPTPWHFFSRYALLSPLVALIIFAGRQYRLARLSYEKYTYKLVVTMSLDSTIEHLKKNFPNDGEAIQKFGVEVYNKLYDEPYFDELAKMKHELEQEKIRYGRKSPEDLLKEVQNEDVEIETQHETE